MHIHVHMRVHMYIHKYKYFTCIHLCIYMCSYMCNYLCAYVLYDGMPHMLIITYICIDAAVVRQDVSPWVTNTHLSMRATVLRAHFCAIGTARKDRALG